MKPRHLAPAFRLLSLLLALAALGPLGLGAANPDFAEDFSKVEPGKVPESFLIIEGLFSVREDAGNRFLELPGSPLESYAAMFGPAKKENAGAQARFQGTGVGRRFPVFGLSIGSVGGYRLQVAPAKRKIELLKGDDTVATAPFVWESGSWTQIRIQIRKTAVDQWIVEGRAWKDGTPEPASWGIAWEEKEEPVGGRAAVWGQPFSGDGAIRFDDLKILGVEAKP